MFSKLRDCSFVPSFPPALSVSLAMFGSCCSLLIFTCKMRNRVLRSKYLFASLVSPVPLVSPAKTIVKNGEMENLKVIRSS